MPFQKICSLRHFTPQFTHSLPVLGQRVTVQSNHPRLPQLFAAAFGESTQPEDSPAGRGVRISLWADDSLQYAGNLPAPRISPRGRCLPLGWGNRLSGR